MKNFLKKLFKKNKVLYYLLNKFRSKKNEYNFNKRIKSIKKNGSATVEIIEKTLTKSGLIYFATCGTLLGLIRENRLLNNDYDLDYAIKINDPGDWNKLLIELERVGFKKIREFSYDNKITEQTYRHKNGIEIDFFGHFIINKEMCFYSYDKISNIIYPSDEYWSVYMLINGAFEGTKKINTDIGTVTVPSNAEEYLTYNYNDDWMIPNPNFKANTGKGCRIIEGKYGVLVSYE